MPFGKRPSKFAKTALWLLKQGQKAAKRGRDEEAIEILDDLLGGLEHVPEGSSWDHVRVIANAHLAACHAALGQDDGARHSLAEARRLQEAIERRDGVDPAKRKVVEFAEGAVWGEAGRLLADGERLFSEAKFQDALVKIREALRMFSARGDRAGEGRALTNLGLIYGKLGRHKEALAQFESSLPISRDLGDRGLEAAALSNIGKALRQLGDARRALEHLERALPIFAGVGDRRGQVYTLRLLGDLCASMGRRQEATQYVQEAIRILGELGDQVGQARALAAFQSAAGRSAAGDAGPPLGP